jgi:hypothetical protein
MCPGAQPQRWGLFDRIEPIYRRYAKAGTAGKIEMWTLAHQSGTYPERDGRAIRWLRAVESDRS